MTIPKNLENYHDVLLSLCQVNSLEEVGENGPPLASVAPSGNEHVASLRLYEAVFGRDSLYMSDQLMEEFPHIARVTLLFLAAHQGVKNVLQSEEEPGRIPHEIRDPAVDTIAQELTKEKGWGWPYYGSIDATPLFVRVVYNYCTSSQEGFSFLQQLYTDKNGKNATMADAVYRAARWVLQRLDASPEGFIETKAAFPNSLVIQSLQDSDTAYPLTHKDGALANSQKGIVITEVQGQAYDALLLASEMLEKITYKAEDEDVSSTIRAMKMRAQVLKKDILRLWNGSYFVAGADYRSGNDTVLQLLDSKKAIPAFLMNTKLFDVSDDEQENIQNNKILKEWIYMLFSSEMLAAAGLRGLGKNEFHFTPYEYHNGSVWPVINCEIARGLRRHGFHSLARLLEDKILHVVNSTNSYPEYVQGGEGNDIEINNKVIYTEDPLLGRKRRMQPPQLFQGWTVSAVGNILYRRAQNKNPEQMADYSIPQFEKDILEKITP